MKGLLVVLSILFLGLLVFGTQQQDDKLENPTQVDNGNHDTSFTNEQAYFEKEKSLASVVINPSEKYQPITEVIVNEANAIYSLQKNSIEQNSKNQNEVIKSKQNMRESEQELSVLTRQNAELIKQIRAKISKK